MLHCFDELGFSGCTARKDERWILAAGVKAPKNVWLPRPFVCGADSDFCEGAPRHGALFSVWSCDGDFRVRERDDERRFRRGSPARAVHGQATKDEDDHARDEEILHSAAQRWSSAAPSCAQ